MKIFFFSKFNNSILDNPIFPSAPRCGAASFLRTSRLGWGSIGLHSKQQQTKNVTTKTKGGTPLRLRLLLRVLWGLVPFSWTAMRAAVQSQRGGEIKSYLPKEGYTMKPKQPTRRGKSINASPVPPGRLGISAWAYTPLWHALLTHIS
jgi:hypothetical protein